SLDAWHELDVQPHLRLARPGDDALIVGGLAGADARAVLGVALPGALVHRLREGLADQRLAALAEEARVAAVAVADAVLDVQFNDHRRHAVRDEAQLHFARGQHFLGAAARRDVGVGAGDDARLAGRVALGDLAAAF